MATYGIRWLAFLLLVFAGSLADDVPTCQPKDFHYEYTECDSSGGRWRVSVPTPGKCIGGAPNPPIRGKDCSYTCSPGQYLNLTGDQECVACPAGTFSLGGGERFEEWSSLPTGFSVESETFDMSMLFPAGTVMESCNSTSWMPRGSFVAAMAASGCATTLVYTAKLVKAGSVTFRYQFVNPEAMFHFSVQNEQCQTARGGDKDSSRWPKPTEEGEWKTERVELTSGMNVLQWRVIGAGDLKTASGRSPVLMDKIEVSGVAFTSSCTKCRAGTYSSDGASYCTNCPANYFSQSGASQCQPCNGNQYAAPGSAQCKERPACSSNDYYEYQTPCDDQKKTKKLYNWVNPQICNPSAPGSVTLPPESAPEDCPPCNPGMEPFNSSACQFCPPGTYSDGASACKPCPASTSPLYAIDYRWWTTMPPNVTSRCLSLSEVECSSTSGWHVAGDHIATDFSPHDDNFFLLLTMTVPGFIGETRTVDGKGKINGHLSFTFETLCTEDCELVLMSDESGRNAIVQTWSGNKTKNTYTHEVRTNKSVSFTWAFQPTSWDYETGKKSFLTSQARIYSIKATDTKGGGAASCKPCPRGTLSSGCVPCPAGHYVDPDSTSCQPCPEGMVVDSGTAWGRESCRACGEGLKPFQGKACRSDCVFTDKQGRHYDFSSLDGPMYVPGMRLFTSTGTQYFHGFNITLCNHGNTGIPRCANNVSADSQETNASSEISELSKQTAVFNTQHSVDAMVCRSTLVPQREASKAILSTQPVSLGDFLEKIDSNVSMEKEYKEAGFPATGTERDVHFHYKADLPTSACPEGRHTVISLRCKPDKEGKGELLLPPKCPDGTCDGCTFHFLWQTQLACPVCRDEDYEVIKGECVGGEQIIHYYAHSYCIPAKGKDKSKMKQKCSNISLMVEIGIMAGIGVGLLLLILLIYLWKRNKKLEYKYMKLVETAGGRDGAELPGVESCAVDEGEDEDAVHFQEKKGLQFFQKLKDKFSGSKEASEGMMTTHSWL